MGNVETEMLAYLKQCLDAGRLSVPGTEILEAVASRHPEWRHRAAYRHGLDRLHRRHVITTIRVADGTLHYYIGDHPSVRELYASLGL